MVQEVEKVVVAYCNKVWKTRNSPNKMKASMFHGGRCWLSDPDHPNYLAGSRATKMVYGVEPDLTREGGSIPVTLTLQEATGKNVILLPMGAADDGAHSQNEKIDIRYGHQLLLFFVACNNLCQLLRSFHPTRYGTGVR